MNGNTSLLQRSIIAAQRIPHLKTPLSSQQEKEMQGLVADNKNFLAQIAALTIANAKLRTRVLVLEDKIATLIVKFPVVKNQPYAGLTFIRPRIAEIVKAVSSYFQISEKEIRGPGRAMAVILPRQIAMYLSRVLTCHSYETIGGAFNDRDHTTIMHSCDKIAELRKIDEELNRKVTEIESQFLLPNDVLDPSGRASLI